VAVLLPLLTLFSLMVLIMLSPVDKLAYDESMHLELSKMLKSEGSVTGMLLADSPSATGPLHTFAHAALSPFTEFRPHAIRWVNLAFVAAACLVASQILTCWDDAVAPRLASTNLALAGAVFAVPVLWPVSCMALTEAPAWLTINLSVLAGAYSLKTHQGKGLLWAGIAGLLLGISICGRQLFLPIFGLTAAVGVFSRRLRLRAVILSASAAILPALLFITWGGTSRPSTRLFTEGAVQWEYLAFSFGYLALAILLISPAWFHKWKNGSILTAALAALIALAAGAFYSPSQTLIQWAGMTGHEVLVGRMAACLLTGLAAACLWSLLCRAWEFREDGVMLFSILATLVLACMPLANTKLFTTRYYIATLPFSLLMLRPWFSPTPWFALRFFCGALIGGLTLWGYYFWTPPSLH